MQIAASTDPVDQHFMLVANDVNLAEIRMGELAAMKATDPAVRAFGQHMIDDHRRVNAQLHEMALRKRVVLPLTLDPANETLYEELALRGGPTFDRQYLLAQINIHSMGNGFYASEAQNGADPDVRRFAADNAPVGVEHLQRAQALMRQGG
jgi:putative membrane protein